MYCFKDVVSVATQGFHNSALKSDGTVVVWGDNSAGQLNVPENLKGVVAVAAGLTYNLTLKSDRTVVAWGANNNGQTNVPTDLEVNP